MKTELTISTDAINEPALAKRRVMDDGMGAVVCFLGVVRGSEGDALITAIEYEAFEPMARHQFGLLFDALGQRWPVEYGPSTKMFRSARSWKEVQLWAAMLTSQTKPD